MVSLEILQKFTGKHLRQDLFLNKIASQVCNFIKKIDSGTVVFLWILRNFPEHLSDRTSLEDL